MPRCPYFVAEREGVLSGFKFIPRGELKFDFTRPIKSVYEEYRLRIVVENYW